MNSRGVILIVTLWIVAMLVVFVLGLGFRMTIEARLTDYTVSTYKLVYVMKAAVDTFRALIAEDDTRGYDMLNEEWSMNEDFFKSRSLGRNTFTVSYVRQAERLVGEETDEAGRVDSAWTEEKIFYGARDETSYIPINVIIDHVIKGHTRCEEILRRIVDGRDDVMNAVLDWVDEEIGGGVTREGGAENDYYEGLDYPYLPKNAALQSVEELLLVRGMTPELFARIKELVTVRGDGKINMNTVSGRALEALGVSEDGIENIIKRRASYDDEEGTDDDVIISDASSGIINVFGLLNNDDKALLGELSNLGLFSVTSSYFRLHVTAASADGKIQRAADVVVSRKDQESTIVQWHEY